MILLRAWKGARVWRELAFVLTAAVLSTPTFALAVLAIMAGALSVVIFGLALLSGVLGLIRLTPRYFRAPARWLLGWTWPDPPPLGRRPAIAVLSDATAWRAFAYCFLRFPLVYIGAYGAVVSLFVGTLGLTYPVWRFFAPNLLDRAGWQVAAALVILLVLPWYLRLIILLDSLLVRALLRPTPAARRIAQLEAGRAACKPTRPPCCAASNGTCTTARRPGWSRSASPCHASRTAAPRPPCKPSRPTRAAQSPRR